MKKISSILILLFCTLTAVAQTSVLGTIKDNTGIPLMGVTVLIKGTAKGTTTDFDGNYAIEVSDENSILTFSFLGFETKQIKVGNQTVHNIILISNTEQIEEVIVVGYGSSTKSDVTASITTVNPNPENKAGVVAIESMLKGASGINVASNGEPGAAVSINIRGVSSLSGSNQPLYVIDGIVMDSAQEFMTDPTNFQTTSKSGIGGVAPEDIESIQVLKDASATAIYGSLGANGVILITTKKGKIGAPKIKFSSSSTIGNAVLPYSMLNTEDFVTHINNKYKEDPNSLAGIEYQFPAGTSPFVLRPDGLYNFMSKNDDDSDGEPDLKGVFEPRNWSDLYKATFSTNTRLTVSGGNEKTKYYTSIGHLSKEGIVSNVYLDKIDLNANVNHRVNDKFKLGAKLSYTHSKNSLTGGSSSNAGEDRSVYRHVNDAFPLELREDIAPLEDESFRLSPRGWFDEYDNISEENRFVGNVSVEYKFSKTLIYNLKFGGDYRKGELNIWQGVGTNAGATREGRYAFSELDRFTYNIDQTLLFRPKRKGDHRYTLLGGVVYSNSNSEKKYTRASNYSVAGQANRGRDFFGASIIESTVYNYSPERLLSFLGRATYAYKDRYKASGSLRYDGSSKFIGENRFGFFPALSLAWEIHKEPFFSGLSSKIDVMKLRVGYGETGNQRVGNNLTAVNYRISPEGYATNGSLQQAFEKTNIASVDLTWETQKQYNIGLDSEMFNNRLSVSIDTYNKTSEDLLNTLSIGGSSGDDSIVVNQGSISNEGIEVAINGDVFKTKDFTWNLYGTYSYNDVEIKSLGLEKGEFGSEGEHVGYFGRPIQVSNTSTVPMNVYLEGRAPGLLFGFETNGILNADDISAGAATINGDTAVEGFYNIIDKNNDGNITNADKVVIGNPNPDFIYSFGTTFNYKTWSLAASFYGVEGNDIYNANYLTEHYSGENRYNNVRQAYEQNRYSSENPTGVFPAVNLEKSMLNEAGVLDVAVSDGSYLRLQNISLGYGVPIKKNSRISDFKVFVSMSNVYTWTKYTGVDPEISSLRFTPGVAGVDIASPPTQRTITIGGAVTF
jgi:TonB-linked SusC/RagA family outer membrane protein